MDYLKKTSFGNSFSTMVIIQDQTEKLLKTFVDVKQYVDENSRPMEDFSSTADKPQTKTKQQT
jgi:hypothetical protein